MDKTKNIIEDIFKFYLKQSGEFKYEDYLKLTRFDCERNIIFFNQFQNKIIKGYVFQHYAYRDVINDFDFDFEINEENY